MENKDLSTKIIIKFCNIIQLRKGKRASRDI